MTNQGHNVPYGRVGARLFLIWVVAALLSVVSNRAQVSPGRIGFTLTRTNVLENQGEVQLDLVRDNGSDGQVSVLFQTYAGTATSGVDYVGATNTIVFEEGETAKTMPVTLLDNHIRRIFGSKTFDARLSLPTGGATLGNNMVTFQISDDDALLTFKPTSLQTFELSTNLVLSVIRTGPTNGLVTLDYFTEDITATAGEDYAPAAGTLTFLPGQGTGTVSVQILKDYLPETNETFRVVFTNIVGSGAFDKSNAVSITITNNGFPGMVDYSYRNPLGFGGGGGVSFLLPQPDGKIIVAGVFAKPGEGLRRQIARVRADGSLDDTFNAPASLDVVATQGALQPDGRILVVTGDVFQTPKLVRYNADGSYDQTFRQDVKIPPPPGSPFGARTRMLVRNDGKIYISGYFDSLLNLRGAPLIRLNPNGAFDTTFAPTITRSISAASVTDFCFMPSGKVLVAGDFDRVNAESRKGLVELQDNGAIDRTFQGAATPAPETLLGQEDGKVLMQGNFTSVNGVASPGLVRLNSDGSTDTTFLAQTIPGTLVGMRQDGKYLFVGFDTLAMLNPDGSDSGFSLEGRSHYAFVTRPDNKFVFFGPFTSINGQAAKDMALMLNEPSPGLVDFALANFSATEGQGPDRAQIRRVGGVAGAVSVSWKASAEAGIPFSEQTGTVTFAADDFTPKTVEILVEDDSVLTRARTITLELSSPVAGGGLGRNATAALTIYDNDAGQLDSTFNQGVRDCQANFVQADGKILFCEGKPGEVWTIRRVDFHGAPDPSFRIATLAQAKRVTFAQQPDGRILLVGEFALVNGQTARNLARLRNDGTVDQTFPAGTDGVVNAVAAQLDGKILLGGFFQRVNGFTRVYVARLLEDGLLDSSYDLHLLPGGHGIETLALYPVGTDSRPYGGAIFGGLFQYDETIPATGLIAASAMGVRDIFFNPSSLTGNVVQSMQLMADGRLLLWGWEEEANPSGLFKNRSLALLNLQHNLDEAWKSTVTGDHETGLNVFALQSDGKVILRAENAKVDGVATPGLLRFNLEGKLDETFSAPALSGQEPLALQADAYVYQGEERYALEGSTTAGKLQFAATASAVYEERGTARVRVERIGGAAGSVTGAFSTVGATAQPGTDFVGGAGNITLEEGEISRTIDVPIIDDRVLENSEELVVQFDPASNSVGAKSSHRISIIQSDRPEGYTPAFASAITLSSAPVATARSGDGGFFLGGAFSDYNNIGAKGLVKLAANGIVDYRFKAELPGANPAVLSLMPQGSEGRILVGGNFPKNLARLNTDGSADRTFDVGEGFDDAVLAITGQPDGKILCGGRFTRLNSSPRTGLARLNPDGSTDTTFRPVGVAGGEVRAVLWLPDGKIAIAGSFTSVNGVPANGLARLGAEGALDSGFAAALPVGAEVNSVVVGRDGRLLAGGLFQITGDIVRDNLARLNADGSLETSFKTGFDKVVRSIAIDSKGNAVVTGDFSYGENPTTFNARLAVLSADGAALQPMLFKSEMTSLDIGIGDIVSTKTVLINPDGSILLTGDLIMWDQKRWG